MNNRATRRLSKQLPQTNESALNSLLHSLHGRSGENANDNGNDADCGENSTLANASRESVGKILERKPHRKEAGGKGQAAPSKGLLDNRRSGEQKLGEVKRRFDTKQEAEPPGVGEKIESPNKRQELDKNDGTFRVSNGDLGVFEGSAQMQEEEDEEEWEDDETFQRSIPEMVGEFSGDIQLEVEKSVPSGKQRGKTGGRRANAMDKEFSRMVHQSHLLCLLARGIAVEASCNDILLQAAMLSVLPSPVTPSGSPENMTAVRLKLLAKWFSDVFKVLPMGNQKYNQSTSAGRLEPERRLHEVLERREGTVEELAVLSVALLRALGLTTRFISILDVVSLKPDAESLEASEGWNPDLGNLGANETVQYQLESRMAGVSLGQALARSLSQNVGSMPLQGRPVEKDLPPKRADAGESPILAQEGLEGEKEFRNSERVLRGGREKVGLNKVDEPGQQKRKRIRNHGKVQDRLEGGAEVAVGDGQERVTKTEKGRRALAAQQSSGERGKQDRIDSRHGRAGTLNDGRKGRQRGGGESVKQGHVAVEGIGLEDEQGTEETPEGKRFRKGDEEYEQELAIAIAATAVGGLGDLQGSNPVSDYGELYGTAKTAQEALSEDFCVPQDIRKPLKSNGRKRGGRLAPTTLGGRLGNESTFAVRRNVQIGPGITVWSRNVQPILHWAEVYCGGDRNGRWVHVDCVAGKVDEPGLAEETVGGCKGPVRYIVAFAGGGAKDVTRRYVTRWSTVIPHRLSEWWDQTLQPLKQLEIVATSGNPRKPLVEGPSVNGSSLPSDGQIANGLVTTPSKTPPKRSFVGIHVQDTEFCDFKNTSDVRNANEWAESSGKSGLLSSKLESVSRGSLHQGDYGVRHREEGLLRKIGDRSAMEDAEMERRTATEPLPTNQQAYRSHPLYALERWLTKYQTLHPRGPVLGYCGGLPVYPRSCVQILHTRDRWLRECRKVRPGEAAVKVVKMSRLAGKDETQEMVDMSEEGGEGSVSELFGKWQTDEWTPPPAVNGRIPRNERGQIDVWSERCLPAGTVHLRLPRLVPVMERLGFDYAPAMVGFEIRGGRSVPKYEGLVVCREHEEVIMDAYTAEERIREEKLLRKRTENAIARWRLLIRAVATRQRLRETYEDESSSLPVKGDNEHVRMRDDEVLEAAIAASVGRGELGDGVGREGDGREATGELITLNRRQCTDMPQTQGRQDEAAHEHLYSEEDQDYDEETGIRTKRCACGFVLEVEEM